MSRPKRTIPKGRYRMRMPKVVDKDKTYSIELEYTWNGEVVRKNVNLQCRVSDWNQKGNGGRGELRPSFGNEYKRWNKLLDSRVNRVDAALVEFNDQHPNQITRDVITDFLSDKPITRRDMGKDFVEFTLEILKSEYSRNAIGVSTYQNSVCYMHMFEEFLLMKELGTHKPNGIYLGEVTPKLIDDYIAWRRTIKRNKDATINHALTPIFKTCQMGKELGYIDSSVNALIQKMYIVVKPSLQEDAEAEECEGKYLTMEQLQQVKQFYETCKEPRRKQYIELFLFSFYACGLRVIDLITLQWGHILQDRCLLRKVQVKTRNRTDIPLRQEALDILAKWKKEYPCRKFVFGLCAETLDLDNEEELYKVRNTVTRCINQSLLVVGEKLKLPINLTMHVARHSFAVFALNSGCSMSVVSRLLGHSSTDITEKIYAQFLPTTLAGEVERLDMGFMK